jgi:hypothetical protein
VDQLSGTLRDRCGHLAITGLRETGHGLDARVYRFADLADLATS